METPRTSAESAHADAGPPPTLDIRCRDTSYSLDPGDGPIHIGRKLPAQIRIDDPRISTQHARIEASDEHWTLTDTDSTNGTFLNGQMVPSVAITDDMTVHLGHPADGIPVTFHFAEQTRVLTRTQVAAPNPQSAAQSVAHAHDSPSDTGRQTDPGVIRAGRAVAERRKALGFSQRKLESEGILSQSALVDFETGRRWPQEATRTRLEEVLGWPPEQIVRIRSGAPVLDEPHHDDPTEALSDTVPVEALVKPITIALRGISAQAAALPAPTDPAFSAAAAPLLAEMRTLEATVASAARSPKMTGAALILGDVRRTYKELMLRAARSPGATLGQRLYAARDRAELSAEEAAGLAGVSAGALADAEADRPLTVETEGALQALIDGLTHR